MRALSGVVLAALLLPGCALVDGLFGVEMTTTDEICASLVPKLEPCDPSVTMDECGAMFSCLNTSRVDGCEEHWRALVQCAFDDETECAPASDDRPRACAAAFDAFVSCARDNGAAAACFDVEDAGPKPCDRSDPDCEDEDPCDTMTCPDGEECVDGSCVAPGMPGASCDEHSDCDGGLVCTSAAELCSRAQMAPGQVCDELDDERRCRVPCASNTDCAAGSRCYLEVPIVDYPPRGVCAPGGCDDDDDCPGGRCVDRDNGPDSGFCAEPCDISSCEPGRGCGSCAMGSCQPLVPDFTDVTGYACLGSGTTPYGSTCEGAGHYSCARGSACVLDGGGGGDRLPTCRFYCSTNADCAEGERCAPAPSPNGGVCVVEEVECGCGAGETCQDARAICEGLADAGLGIECGELASGQQCYEHCSLDGAVVCQPGRVCLPTNPSTSLAGVCVDAPCSEDAECPQGAACVHFGGSPGSVGFCLAECLATSCTPGTGCTSCPNTVAQCLPAPRAEGDGTALDLVCAGAGSSVVGSACDPTAPSCGPGLGCVDAGDGFMCAELCGPALSCAEGGTCEAIDDLYVDEVDDVGGACVTTEPPVCSSCDGDDVCVNGNDVCVATPSLNPFHDGCPWLDVAGCAVGCATDAECASSARCVLDPLSGDRFCLFGECGPGDDCGSGRACVADGGGDFAFCAERCDPVACANGSCDCPLERPACTGVPAVSSLDLTFVCVDAASATLSRGQECTLGEVGCPAGSLCATNPADGTPRCLDVCDVDAPCTGVSTCGTAETGAFWHPGVQVCSWEL